MRISKEWVEALCKKYGVKPKIVRDALWPEHKTRGLGYFDQYENVRVKYAEIIADELQCTVDEVLRRPIPQHTGQMIAGDNNQVGNVNINSDVESLKQIIEAQRQIISHQDAEIKRMEQNTKEQLKVKDRQIDRLIQIAEENGKKL